MAEPIAALASAPGLGGVALIRLSGEGVYAIADRLAPRLSPPPSDRPAGTFAYATLRGPEGEALDDAVLLFYRAPHSYTGEDTVELCVHGGAVVPQRVLDALFRLGARPAGPGEFTRRAFLNGRLDLTQAEAVADLIAAKTPRAEQAARANLHGRLSNALTPLYDDALALSADVEHLLDFDEGELPPDFADQARERLADLADRAHALLATWRQGRLLRQGALVVLAGPPNAGKSTLLNALLGADRAIVSPEPGTTRDSIEEALDLDGVPLRLVDTAGLRDAPGDIERQGVARAKDLIARADVVLCLLPPGEDPPPDLPPAAILLRTKSDLLPTPPCGAVPGVPLEAPCGAVPGVPCDAVPVEPLEVPCDAVPGAPLEAPCGAKSVEPLGVPCGTAFGVPSVSANTSGTQGPGTVERPAGPNGEVPSPLRPFVSSWRPEAAISALADPEGARKTVFALLRQALATQQGERDVATLATERQYAGLAQTLAALQDARAALDRGEPGLVPAAQRLRDAADALGQILGRVYADDLLDRLFSHFCIGK